METCKLAALEVDGRFKVLKNSREENGQGKAASDQRREW